MTQTAISYSRKVAEIEPPRRLLRLERCQGTRRRKVVAQQVVVDRVLQLGDAGEGS